MKLYKLIMFRLSKKDTPSAMTSAIFEALRQIGDLSADIKFFLSDMSSFNTSGISRLTKKMPRLSKYVFAEEAGYDPFLPASFMSNLSADWDSGHPDNCTDPLLPEEMSGIINGIPRRYPLNDATFIIDSLDILRRDPQQGAIAPVPYTAKGYPAGNGLFIASSPISMNPYPSPCIVLQTNWWINGRHNFLSAVAELGDAADGAEVTSLRPETRHFLNQLGEIDHEMLFAVPSDPLESAAIREKAAKTDSYLKSFFNEIGNVDGVRYPNTMESLSINIIRVGPISVKKAVIHNFAPLGFTYVQQHSGYGKNTMVKRTDNHNQIKLTFMTDKFGLSLSCTCSMEGPLWKHSFDLPYCTSGQLPVLILNKQNDVDLVTGNMAAAYQFLEPELISFTDRLYGAAPDWYNYL
ncbi:hypothetical protein M2108_002351 [Paenibacillus sp. PastM-3]|nr:MULTISPECIES: hypothetical protein [unclassified Paenibacillus]MDF9848110.1 hypothetical protein [Paenibacillus sp. PastM-2]MDH6507384.1 hypothetical protein [Paenibacillus sp. PastM-3]